MAADALPIAAQGVATLSGEAREQARHRTEIIGPLAALEAVGHGAAIDTTTAAGKLVFGIFAALAEFERRLVTERTIAGLASARAAGTAADRSRWPPPSCAWRWPPWGSRRPRLAICAKNSASRAKPCTSTFHPRGTCADSYSRALRRARTYPAHAFTSPPGDSHHIWNSHLNSTGRICR